MENLNDSEDINRVWENIKGNIKTLTKQSVGLFHCFTVHFDSLNFIHTNSCTFSYNHVSVFKVILKSLKTL